MARNRQSSEIKRRIPRQQRANETIAAILEAAAQILEAGGLAAFTTNAVADMSTPVDRSKPDTGFNRSAMQRFLSLIHDTNGVTASNKSYDNATSATLVTTNAALVGVVNGDTVTLGSGSATGTFASSMPMVVPATTATSDS